MFAGLVTVLSAIGSIISSDSVSDITKKLTQESELSREQQTSLLTLQNQAVANAQQREIAIEKIDPKANWPLYALMYIAIIVIGMVNIESFVYPSVFADYTKVIDASLVSAVTYYLLGKNT